MKHVIEIEEDPVTGELFLPLPQEMMDAVGIQIGDEIEWIDNGDGTWCIVKKEVETEFVMVETTSTHRMRYVVEVPKGKAEWALDSVTCEDVVEFSQHWLGEQIVSHRVLRGKEEVLDICNQDNDFLKTWTDEQKIDRLTAKLDSEGNYVRGKVDWK
jgi:bifunctional DNA-binding transcriptional regulator/antitoxin component of YhaV-PrlF toxin-antitoxin module